MKKLIIVIIICIAAFNTKAQDIILTKDGQKIEAKIEEVGIKTVKYKKFNNQSGTSYLIKKNDIASIKYENGDTEAFNEKVTNLQSNETDNLKIKYEGQVEIGNNYQVAYYSPTYDIAGVLFYKISKNIITYDFMFYNGVILYDRVFCGIGVGIEGAFWKELSSITYRDYKNSTLSFPILGRIKVSLLKDKKVNPFILFNVGYNIVALGYGDYGYYRSGAIINPCFGIDFNFLKKIGFYIHSGYLAHINKDSQNKSSSGTINFASLKFGVRF